MERRLLGRNEGRTDDNIDTIRKRFKVGCGWVGWCGEWAGGRVGGHLGGWGWWMGGGGRSLHLCYLPGCMPALALPLEQASLWASSQVLSIMP